MVTVYEEMVAASLAAMTVDEEDAVVSDPVSRLREAAQQKKVLVLKALGVSARCSRCGYDRYIGALEFHHLDPKEKDGLVLNRGLAAAIEEARKCILVCANCHRELHAGGLGKRTNGRPRRSLT